MHMCLFTLSGIEREKETMMGVDAAQKCCTGLPCREFLLKCLIRLITLNRHLYLTGVWLWIEDLTTKRHHVFKRDWTTSSKSVYHSRLNRQHNWGAGWGWGLYDHLLSSWIFNMTLDNKFIWAPKYISKMAIITIWICQSSCNNCGFHNPIRSGSRTKSFHLTPAYLFWRKGYSFSWKDEPYSHFMTLRREKDTTVTYLSNRCRPKGYWVKPFKNSIHGPS